MISVDDWNSRTAGSVLASRLFYFFGQFLGLFGYFCFVLFVYVISGEDKLILRVFLLCFYLDSYDWFYLHQYGLCHGSGGKSPASHRGGPGSIPGSVHVGLVVDKLALGQVFPRVLRFPFVIFIPPVLHYTEKRKKTNHLLHRVAQ
jgi:hypothetical protein